MPPGKYGLFWLPLTGMLLTWLVRCRLSFFLLWTDRLSLPQQTNNQCSHKNILKQDPRVPMFSIYLYYIPGGRDPSALYSNAIKTVCVSISTKRHLCQLCGSLSCSCLCWYCTIRASGRACAALTAPVGVDRQEVSAPRVPSESDGGGLDRDVFLQITHR